VIGFMLRRAAQAVLVVFAASSLTFFLLHLAPGDPFTSLYQTPGMTAALQQAYRARAGLDLPLGEQYARYVANVARGDFGWSESLHMPVSEAMAAALPNTLLLMGTGLALAFVLGIGLGVLQAARRGSWIDRGISTATLVLYSMTDYWLAIVGLLLFTSTFRIFPAGGMRDAAFYDYMTSFERVRDRLWHLALPALTVTLLVAALVARHQRAAMLDVMDDDYVRTARAKGLDERGVTLRHAWRNALVPVISLFGMSVPSLVGGAVFIERVYGWPGIGGAAFAAIAARDYALLTAIVIVGSAMVALGNLVADLLHAAADPRVRAS
jgi:peptide/nickel transport system permease protein